MKTKNIALFIASHGFSPLVFPSGAILFAVPFVNTITGEKGDELHRVTTWEEARNALGY